jgi:hypothetical protein
LRSNDRAARAVATAHRHEDVHTLQKFGEHLAHGLHAVLEVGLAVGSPMFEAINTRLPVQGSGWLA